MRGDEGKGEEKLIWFLFTFYLHAANYFFLLQFLNSSLSKVGKSSRKGGQESQLLA